MTYIRLEDRDKLIIEFVNRFRMVTAKQIERLFFADGSLISRDKRRRRTLARLVKWGQLSRLGRPMGGSQGGSESYVYLPATSRARVYDPHTLDITELYVRLVESETVLLSYDPEPWCHEVYGNTEVKPDAKARIRTSTGTYQWYIEIDLASEWRSQLAAKMRRFVNAYHQCKHNTFPLVIFVVPDEARLRLVQGVSKRQEMPELFKVVTNENALETLGA